MKYLLLLSLFLTGCSSLSRDIRKQAYYQGCVESVMRDGNIFTYEKRYCKFKAEFYVNGKYKLLEDSSADP